MDLEIFKAITQNSLAYELSSYSDSEFIVVSRKDQHFNTQDTDYWNECKEKSLLNDEFLSLNIFNVERADWVHPNFISGYMREFTYKNEVPVMVVLTSISTDDIQRFIDQLANFKLEVEHPKKEDMELAKKVLKGHDREAVYVIVPLNRIHSFCIRM